MVRDAGKRQLVRHAEAALSTIVGMAIAMALAFGVDRASATPSLPTGNGLILFESFRSGVDRFFYLSSSGTGLRELHLPHGATEARFRPDGQRLAIIAPSDTGLQVFLASLAGIRITRLSYDANNPRDLAWSPEADLVSYDSRDPDSNQVQVFYVPGNEMGPGNLAVASAQDDYDAEWSPDHRWLSFIRRIKTGGDNSQGDIFLQSLSGPGSGVRRLTNAPSEDVEASWSPDGRTLVFVSDRGSPHRFAERSKTDLYTINVNDGSSRRLTNTSLFENDPVFSPDGSKIAFSATDGHGRSAVAVMNSAGGGRCYLHAEWGTVKVLDWQRVATSAAQPKCASFYPERTAAVQPCSARGAVAAIDASSLPKWVAGLAHGANDGSVSNVQCRDVTRDGRAEMIAEMFGGGTAGNVAWLVFRRIGGAWRLALFQHYGEMIAVDVANGDPVETTPIYRKNDGHCCPSGGILHRRFHWNGSRFVLAKRWVTP